MCEKKCTLCKCLSVFENYSAPLGMPILYGVVDNPPGLYTLAVMIDGTEYRIYGPHVYKYEAHPSNGKHVIQNHWHPTDIYKEHVLDNAVEIQYF